MERFTTLFFDMLNYFMYITNNFLVLDQHVVQDFSTFFFILDRMKHGTKQLKTNLYFKLIQIHCFTLTVYSMAQIYTWHVSMITAIAFITMFFPNSFWFSFKVDVYLKLPLNWLVLLCYAFSRWFSNRSGRC